MKQSDNDKTGPRARFKSMPLAQQVGIIVLPAALFLSIWDIEWAIVLLAVYVFICLTAPFFPGIGFFLPILTHGDPRKNTVALTFDDGPDPRSTPALLSLLSRKNTPATFFVTGKRAAEHPDLIRALIQNGHTIGNHTYHHDTLIMLKSEKKLSEEIQRTQEVLSVFGIQPVAFRPPVGITNPKLGKVLSRLGMICVNYRCRALDIGNRRIENLSRKILRTVRSGDIILLHDVVPPRAAPGFVSDWLIQIEMIIDGIRKKGLAVIPLADLIQQPVMKSIQTVTPPSHPE